MEDNLPQYYRSILNDFRRVTKSYVAFNLIFLALFTTELLLFIFLFSKTAVVAMGLGALFLTIFSYFILMFYFQTKKPDQLVQLKEQFIESCKEILSDRLSMAEALSKLASYLNDFEKNIYSISSPILTRFSSYCYGEDVFKMKVLLVKAAIDEHLKQIQDTPTDLAVHASLANTYAALSKIYRSGPNKNAFELKFRNAAQLALEEFRILSHFAPNDPWAHEQLAAGYRDLGMFDEELREVENLNKLKPLDKEVLFRLGTLYFKQGLNAKGLQIYKELKNSSFKKAGDLISFYGTIPL